ncbi:MAG: hypothetical protein COZ80_09370, partial [Ignavibacteria bacterium CG_4_8_14_3_um_filter_37_9]
MSLRKLVPLPINQEKMPKISKPRKKTTTTVKKTIPQKKEASVEYIVTVFFKFDQRLKKQFSVISLATVKLFTSLSYEISVDVQKGKNSIDIRL